MKVAILQCDQVHEKFQTEFGSYSVMIQNMFNHIDESLDFDVFDCQQGHYPNDINNYDFYITTGSKANSFDKTPWIIQLVDFVKTLHQQKKKLIGICFGHQIMALALGKTVTKSDKGWGVGIAQNEIVSSPEWMGEKKPELNLLVSHQDQVNEIPEDATIIARTDFCPHFMLQWNDHFLSVQGHPEWKTSYSKTLMNFRRDRIPADRIDEGMDSLSIAPDNALFARWILDFVKY